MPAFARGLVAALGPTWGEPLMNFITEEFLHCHETVSQPTGDLVSYESVDAALWYAFCRGDHSVLAVANCEPIKSLAKRAYHAAGKPLVFDIFCAIVQPEIDLRTINLQHTQELSMAGQNGQFSLPKVVLATLSSPDQVINYLHAEEVACAYQKHIAHLAWNGLAFVADARMPGTYRFQPGHYTVRHDAIRVRNEL